MTNIYGEEMINPTIVEVLREDKRKTRVVPIISEQQWREVAREWLKDDKLSQLED